MNKLLLVLLFPVLAQPVSAGVLADCNELFAYNPVGTRLRLPSKENLTMFRYFGTTDSQRKRQDRNSVMHYKNEVPNLNPITLDLDDPQLKEKSPALKRLYSYSLKNAIEFGVDGFNLASEYAHKVMLLRKGDVIRVDGKDFRLGDYLGAGNTTHIYQYADDPSKVVRIPFYALGNAQAGGKDYMMRLFMIYEDFPSYIPHVEIYEQGKDGSYGITDYVNGTINGREFLQREKEYDPEVFKRRRLRLYQLANKFNDPVERQFVWDIMKEDWIMVDWE